MKRYSDMIRRYCDVHKHVWPEIMEGQKQVGILDMQIFRRGTHVFMICDTVDDFDWEKDWERLAGMPRRPAPSPYLTLSLRIEAVTVGQFARSCFRRSKTPRPLPVTD